MSSWLCELGHALSNYAFADLTRAMHSSGRLQYSETGITHVLTRLVWDVAERNGRRHQVMIRETTQAQESKVGADLELWFIDGAVGFGWLIQAKRLYPPGSPTLPPRFRRLDHKVGRRLQATVLLDNAAEIRSHGHSVAALYWLYAFDPVGDPCMGAPSCRCGASDPASGILVAEGSQVREVVLRRRRTKEPFSFHRWFYQGELLTSILCEAGTAPRSGEAFDALSTWTSDRSPDVGVPSVLPDYILALISIVQSFQDGDGGQANLDGADGDVDSDSPNEGSPFARNTVVIDLSE